jgi:electron transfer flavoprotein beta subunit
VIKNKYKPDIILTGVQSTDYSSAQVGGMLAELLDIPHASIVTHAELKNNTKLSNMDCKREISTENLSVAEFTAEVHRELEGGLKEIVNITLPAVLTIQSGINEPRYASMIGIRRAKDKEIKIVTPEDLGLPSDELKLKTCIENMFIPPKGRGAEIITGTAEESATKLCMILKDKRVFT